MATGEVTTLAGTPYPVVADGIGTAARFTENIGGITTDGTYIYVADESRLRKVLISTKEVTSLPIYIPFYFRLNGITTDGSSVYAIREFGDEIFKFDIMTGVTSVFSEVACPARLNGITTDGANLYVTCGDRIIKVDITTGVAASFVDAPALELVGLRGTTTDGTSLYVAEESRYRFDRNDGSTIRKVDIATRKVTTLAERAGVFASVDRIGTAAQFYNPYRVTTDGTNLYVIDAGNLRKIILATGEVTTIETDRSLHEVTTDGVNLFLTQGGGTIIRMH